MGVFDSINRFMKSGSSDKPTKLKSLEGNNFFGLLKEIHRVGNAARANSWDSIKYAGIPAYEEVKKFDDGIKKQFIDYLIEYMYEFSKWRSSVNNYDYNQSWSDNVASDLLPLLLKQKIDFKFDELLDYLNVIRVYSRHSLFYPYPVHYVFIQIEKLAKDGRLTAENIAQLQEITQWDDIQANTDDGTKARKRIANTLFLASGEEAKHPVYKFDINDQFGIYANEWVAQLDSETREHVDEILRLCSNATQSKPTERFRKNVKASIDQLSIKKFKEIVTPLFEFVIAMKEQAQVIHHTNYEYTYFVFLSSENSTVLKGLVWCYSHFFDSHSLGVIAKLGERSFKKIPGVGPASAAIGNACIYTLSASKGLEGVSHLSRLKLVLTQNNAQKLVQKYIDEISVKLKISSDEIEDMSVQEFDLIQGKKEVQFEDYVLKLAIEKIGAVSQQWIKPDGNAQKSAPSFIKESKTLSSKLKKIQAEVKVIAKMVTTGRDRLDRSFVNNRKMTWEYFKKYYLDHGLMNFLVKDLVWHFEKGELSDSALLLDGEWKNLKNEVVNWIDEESTVRLWHPVFCASKVTLAWREKLIELQLKQPLKQVFREVYLLTDAEIATRIYSNRMAAHILKQHQFNALTAIRGWKYSLLGAYDDGRDGEWATKQLPNYEMNVQFWVLELASNDDFSDSGIWNYISTDQVRFVDRAGEPLDLIQIPKIVLSEILRDVDLFVGVCSVGNDPEWMDNQGNAQHRTYWESYSFGDLNEIAKTRKTILEGIVPKLKIGKVAHIDGKFLVVAGKLRTYKIHLGSTNILMEPNDQYLCIVPSRAKDNVADKVFLPFDGDKGLSVIISKAILLADDDKIKDTTITSQINR